MRNTQAVAVEPSTKVAGVKLDDLDRALLAALEDDGRRPYRDIGRDLDVPEATVRSRVSRLLESGLIHITAVGDPLALGVEVAAITLLRLRPGSVQESAEVLTAYANVRFVGASFGAADLIIQTLHHDIDELHRFVTEALPAALEGLVSTETFQLAKVHKSSWDWRAWFAAQDAAAQGEAATGGAARRRSRNAPTEP